MQTHPAVRVGFELATGIQLYVFANYDKTSLLLDALPKSDPRGIEFLLILIQMKNFSMSPRLYTEILSILG